MNAPESPPQMRENALSGTPLVKCEGCSILFAKNRPHQKFHSDACRMEYHRRKGLGPEGQIAELHEKVKALKEGTEDLKRRVTALEGKAA